jgi:hypothetical protein
MRPNFRDGKKRFHQMVDVALIEWTFVYEALKLLALHVGRSRKTPNGRVQKIEEQGIKSPVKVHG